MKKSVLILVLIILAFSVNAQTQTLGGNDGYAPGIDIELIQICANCTFVNITTVKLGNGTLESFNSEMSMEDSVYNFSLSFLYTTSTGEYIVNWLADPDGIVTSGNYNFFVRNNATFLTTGESILYIALIIISLLSFLFFLYIAISMPFTDSRDEKGALTRLVPSKYIKLISIWFSFGTFLWFLNILAGIVNNFVSLQLAKNLISNSYTYMTWLTYGVTLLILSVLMIMFYIDLCIPIIKILLKRLGKRKYG